MTHSVEAVCISQCAMVSFVTDTLKQKSKTVGVMSIKGSGTTHLSLLTVPVSM